ncbi:MAG: efflux RND transporter permease subunit [Planctomycetaceae bacterium]
MDLIHFAVHNPVKVAVGVIFAVLFGMLALWATPIQLTPDVTEPEVTVTTVWPGASAQEIEREIIEEQEEQLKSVEGLKEFKSQSTDSTGTIVLKFEVGSSLADARARVSEKLNQVAQYPPDAREPIVTTVNPTANAIAWFILSPIPPKVAELKQFVAAHPEAAEVLAPMISGENAIELSTLSKFSDEFPAIKELLATKNDAAKLRKFAEEQIESRFERVEGVANSNVFGGREQELHITVDPAKLASFGLTVSDLRTALVNQNKNTSGGDIWEGKNRDVIRTLAQFESIEQVEATVVAMRDNSPIRVRDIAFAEISYKKPDGVVRQKSVEGLAVNAQQAPGTNVLEVIGPPIEQLDLNGDGQLTALEISSAKLQYGDSLRIAAAELNLGILKQLGVQLEQVYDQSEYIYSATELVTGNIYIGGTLAIIILLIFLRSPRSVLIIGISIPISVIATFLFMKSFGRSINVISLAGIAFAVGMVVDNAIVVLENIYRHYQLGESVEEATRKGASEVWGAVLASTLTTLAVFIPVIFAEGQAGQLFKDIALAISCSVGLSLIVSVTVVPAASRYLLPKKRIIVPAERQWKLFGLVALGQWVNGLLTGGLKLVHTMPLNGIVRIAIVLAFAAGSLWGIQLMMPEIEYLPDGNRNLVIAIVSPPPGYNVDHMVEMGRIIEKELAPYWEAKPGSPEAAALDGPQLASFFFVARGRQIFMGARSVDPLRAAELVPVLTRAAGKVPGVFAFAKQTSLFENALTGGRTIEIEITGPNLEVLVQEGRKVFGQCMQEFPMAEGNQMRPDPSLDLTSPELHIVPKLEEVAELGLNASDLGYAVDALIDGAFAGEYWHDGRKIDMVIYGAPEYSSHSQDVGQLPLNTPTGRLVSLASVADIHIASGPEQVNHSERTRTITILLTPRPTLALETALNIVNEKIVQPMNESPTFETGQYQIRLAGTADKLDETWREMRGNLLLALVITYLLMAGLFESFFYPLVIIFSVMFGLVGGVAGLAALHYYTGQSADMLTMLGFIILIGTVVNNAILIVHQSLNNMKEFDMPPVDAVIFSVSTRTRPIFMTTLTTVLGMMPLVFPNPSYVNGEIIWAAGAGSELYRGMGSVILGGLSFSTVITLVLIPISFTLAMDAKRMLSALRARLLPDDETVYPAGALVNTPSAAAAASAKNDAVGSVSFPKYPDVKQPAQRQS